VNTPARSYSPPPPPPPLTGSQLTKEESVAANETAQEPLINKTSSPQLLPLSDGTKITLESESALTVIAFTQAGRQVRLQGKAFFDADDVQRSFYVYAENGATQALSAGFIVNASHADGETFKTGRAAVFPKEQKSNSATKYYATITPNPGLPLVKINSLKIHYELEILSL